MLLDRLECEARIWSWGIEFTIGIIMTTSWGFVTRNMIIREHICTNISFFLEPLQKDQKFFFFFSFWVWGGFLGFFFFWDIWYLCWYHAIWQLKKRNYLNPTSLDCVLGLVTWSFCFLCFFAWMRGHKSTYSQPNEMIYVKTSPCHTIAQSVDVIFWFIWIWYS